MLLKIYIIGYIIQFLLISISFFTTSKKDFTNKKNAIIVSLLAGALFATTWPVSCIFTFCIGWDYIKTIGKKIKGLFKRK